MQQALREREFYTYAVQEDGRTLALYFLRRQKHRIIVLNGDSNMQGVALFRFSRFIFDHFSKVRDIRFFTSERYLCRPSRFGRRSPGKNRLMNRLILPDHPSSQLEEAIRFNKRSVKYFLRRLAQDFSGYRFEFFKDEAIPEETCLALLSLPRPRLAKTDKVDAPADETQSELLRDIRSGGLVCTLKIEGKLVAGLICQRLGQNLYLRFLAHDPRMQAYGLGMLCCYFAACDSLKKPRKEKSHVVTRAKYSGAVTVQTRTFAAMCIQRPHASLLIRCDVALYSFGMDILQRYRNFSDECRQLGDSLVRLMSAWKLLYQRVKSWRTRFASSAMLPAFLRGQ